METPNSSAQFRYIYAYAWREWDKAAPLLGKLGSKGRSLRILGPSRIGEKGRVNWRGALGPTVGVLCS